jgi:sugar lactone lactonase YvrE
MGATGPEIHLEPATGPSGGPGSSRAAARSAGLVAAAVMLTAALVTTTGTVGASAASPAGVIFVANFGGAGASGIEATGSVTSYHLNAAGDARALRTFASKINAPQGVVFDSSGDLWVANSNTNTLFEYTKSELGKASPTPAVTVSSGSSGSLSGPGGLAFDHSGNLWVANTSVSTVVEYSKSQLTKSGAPTPEVTISNNSFNTPFGVAIDSSGNLWVSDNAQQGSPAVYEYTESELAKANPTPRLTISLPLSPLGDDTRSGLGFDSSGNLWFVNSAGNSLLEFSKAELKKAVPKPTVTISAGSANALNAPDDLVFDRSGDVWVANTGASTVVEFSKSELAKSGSPAPARTISGQATGLNYPMSLAVEPAAPAA